MASHVVVIDTSFRRHNIKVTPGKYMTDVLEEACGKFGIKSSNYGLKHSNKPVDLSRTFRQTGLTTGAKLELVVTSRTPSVVSVALQLPESSAASVPGGRLTDKVPSDTTLWRILRKFESTDGANLNFTGRGVTHTTNGNSGAGQIVYEMPILNVMGRELATFPDLQKNLAQLGFNSGSCLIRLTFRRTEQPLQEAMTQIEQYFSEESANSGDQISPTKEVDSVTKDISKISTPSQDPEVAGLETQEPQITAPITPSKRPASEDPPEPTKEGELFGPNQRPISVFSPPSTDTPIAASLPHNEKDFELTIQQAKAHQKSLETRGQNKKLLSYDEIAKQEQEKVAKLANVKVVNIMVRFPDQSRVQLQFAQEDTGANLYEQVVALIVAPDQPFKLVWNENGVRTVPNNDQKLIKDLGLKGSVLINFQWEEGVDARMGRDPALKPELRQQAKALPVPQIFNEEPAKEDASSSTVNKGKGKETSAGDGKPKGMPKWFKGLGKK